MPIIRDVKVIRRGIECLCLQLLHTLSDPPGWGGDEKTWKIFELCSHEPPPQWVHYQRCRECIASMAIPVGIIYICGALFYGECSLLVGYITGGSTVYMRAENPSFSMYHKVHSQYKCLSRFLHCILGQPLWTDYFNLSSLNTIFSSITS